ncbi:MAG: PAS domain-containing protein [Oscillospiraceae bacterium]|nr:PAS domain-containing protein [Oscillospiraceae bacterium]
MAMRTNMKLMFERSDQAVLLLEKSVICYANPRAQKLLGLDPTDMAIVDLADFKFVKECFSRHSEAVTHHKHVRFQNQCFHVSRTEFDGYTLLFLHFRKEAQFTETFLHDTLLSLISQIEKLPDSRQKREIETLANSSLAVSTPTCTLTDFREFLRFSLSHFDCFEEQHRLTVELEESDATVFLYAELMYLTLIWIILDLLQITGADGKLTVSYKRVDDSARLSFRAENASCPKELYQLLFAEPPSNPLEVLYRNGSALFRAKRVFALHDSVLEYSEFQNGFAISAGLSIVSAPPTLYAPLSSLLSTWSVDPEELQRFIRSYLEEA